MFKYESMQVHRICKHADHANVREYASMQLCEYASIQVWKYASIEVFKHASIEACRYAGMLVWK